MAPERVRLGNRRVTGKEQFHTPPAVADAVVALVLSLDPALADRRWLEPAGGTGVFLDAYARAGVADMWSCDIEPLDPRVTRADFLACALPAGDRWITVTNPPFGRNNALSVPFFNRAADVSDLIAFVVPRSWRKWSVTNRLDPRFHLIADEDLAIDYVGPDGAPLSRRGQLRTCIQVWERREALRPKVVVEDRGYIRRVAPEAADVSLTIFGRGCGTLRADFPRVPNTTQLFLALSGPEVVDALSSVDFGQFFNRVAYTEALSIMEINYLLNEYFDARAKPRTSERRPSQMTFDDID